MKAVSAAASASSGASAAAAMPLVGVVPEAAQEARGEAQRAVGPVERLGRPGGVEDREPHRVGAVLGDQLVGVDDVAEVLAHLAAVGDHHLVEEAAGEGLAVGEEGERADVAQRLRHDPLVEDEAAAVVAGDEPLGGQPAPQVGVGEHLLGAVLGRDRGRDPEPERVEVAVERVGLAPRGAAAARAGRLEEVGALGQRVALAGRLDVARQPHRQVLDRHRDDAALARSGRPGSACPSSAGARSRSRRRGSGVASRASSAAAGARRAARSALRGIARGDRLVGLVDGGDAERRGRPVAGVDDRRDEDRQLAAAGDVDRGAGVDHRHRRGVAGAALPAAGAQLVELLGDLRAGRPALDLRVARREQHEAGVAERARRAG